MSQIKFNNIGINEHSKGCKKYNNLMVIDT